MTVYCLVLVHLTFPILFLGQNFIMGSLKSVGGLFTIALIVLCITDTTNGTLRDCCKCMDAMYLARHCTANWNYCNTDSLGKARGPMGRMDTVKYAGLLQNCAGRVCVPCIAACTNAYGSTADMALTRCV